MRRNTLQRGRKGTQAQRKSRKERWGKQTPRDACHELAKTTPPHPITSLSPQHHTTDLSLNENELLRVSLQEEEESRLVNDGMPATYTDSKR